MRLRSIIGKRWQKIAAAACAIALLTALALCASRPLSGRKAGERALNASQGLDEYSYELIFRPEESTLAVTMTLDCTNRTGNSLETLVLRTWAGAYASEKTSPAAVDEFYDACYPEGFDPGGVAVEGVWWNGDTADIWPTISS